LRSIWVGDYVISSYAPMLSTLLPSDDNYLFVLNSPRTLAIGQAQGRGVSALPGTIEELEHIWRICGERVTLLEGDQANIACVVAELGSAELVHIASHGQQIDPGFDSGLILRDGCLQISELIRQRVPLGRLAFLSACETAKGRDFVLDEYTKFDRPIKCSRPRNT
jgi:CHAT domain-containing protein